MVIIKRINYRDLKKDLLDYAGPSGIWPLIGSIDGANEDELLNIAKQLGYDISDYMSEEEDYELDDEEDREDNTDDENMDW